MQATPEMESKIRAMSDTALLKEIEGCEKSLKMHREHVDTLRGSMIVCNCERALGNLSEVARERNLI